MAGFWALGAFLSVLVRVLEVVVVVVVVVVYYCYYDDDYYFYCCSQVAIYGAGLCLMVLISGFWGFGAVRGCVKVFWLWVSVLASAGASRSSPSPTKP